MDSTNMTAKSQNKTQQSVNQSKSSSRIQSLYQIKNSREKYTQSTSKLQSRLLDNHVYQPHSEAWIACGITPAYKYNFADSGLGFVVNDQYQIKLNETRHRILEQKKSEEVKFYPEFKNVKDKDCIIIIEFCNDCKNHEGTTRHDEEYYLKLANTLRIQILRHFPIAKLFMKPVRVDPNASSLENIQARQRIGAFEIYAMSNSQGNIKKGCIHSKLKSGKWPNQTSVLDKLSQYMVTCTLSLSLTLCDFDSTDFSEEDLLNRRLNKLMDISVSLRPYREKQYSINSGSISMNTNNNMSQTRISRPLSGISRRSEQDSKFLQSNSSLFGNDEITKKNNEIFQGKTNKHGQVIFEDIPTDVYILEVKETNDFKSLKESINIFELMKNKQGLDLHYELQHFNLTFLTITASYKTLKDTKIEKLRNALIKIYSQNEKSSSEPIVEENFDGVFVITLEPGSYLIKIEKDGYQTIEQQYFAQPGQQEQNFPPITKYIDDEPKKEMDSKTRFQNRPSSSARKGILKSSESQSQKINGKQSDSIMNSEEAQNPNSPPRPPAGGVKIQESEKQSNARFSNNGLNNNQSITESPQQVQKQARPVSSNPLKKSSQDNSLIQSISSPEKLSDDWSFNKIEKQKLKDASLLKAPSKNSEIKLTGFCNSSITEFYVITPDQVNIRESVDNIIIQNEVKSQKIGLWIKDSQKYKSGVYRIYAKILNNKQFNAQNLKVYASSLTSTTFLQIPDIQSAHIDQNLYWDIGIFDVSIQKFFEINNYTSQIITRDWLLEPFGGLLNYLNASRPEIKKILGFDSQEKQVFEDDVYVKKETILKSLENYEFEGSSSIDHFLQSASNHKGYFSFKKLEQKLIHKELEKRSCQFMESSSKKINGKNEYDDEEDEKYQEEYFDD